jgi:dihydrodiol dehydrogenase / D-xylose 1-dehydrogenase (NADP)
MQEKIRWGILGCGYIARAFAKSLLMIPDATLVAVASRTPRKAKEFADEFRLTRWFKTYEELLQDPKIDIVYIATTHNFHFDNMRLCLNYDKHIVCEKPFTLNERSAREIFRTAKRKKLFVLEAMWTRFLPAIVELQKKLREEVIGEIHKVQADFWINIPYDANHRLYAKKLAGGALLDLGIYPLTFADIVFNTAPIRITSRAILGKSGVDEASYYLLEYKGNRVAQLSSSCRAAAPHRATIIGTKGYIEVPDFFHPQEFTINHAGGKSQRVKAPYKVNGYIHEAIEAMQCLRAGSDESKIMSHAKTLEILKLMDAMRAEWKLKYPGE